MVVMLLRSISTVSVMHEATASPLTITVQQPQAPVPHDCFAPVICRRWRSVSMSVSAGDTSPMLSPTEKRNRLPFIVSEMDSFSTNSLLFGGTATLVAMGNPLGLKAYAVRSRVQLRHCSAKSPSALIRLFMNDGVVGV